MTFHTPKRLRGPKFPFINYRFETKLSRKTRNDQSILDFHLYKRERAAKRDISIKNQVLIGFSEAFPENSRTT